jgi:hypothetical protein
LLLSVAVFVRRGVAAADAAMTAPGVAVTSGYEEESIFALWRAVHDQPVYVDSSRLPYASAYFNWLFYGAYAAPVRVAASLGGDGAIVLGSRLMTAVGALAGAGVLFWLLRRVLGGQPLVAAALAGFVFFGPLVGWWAYTLRPDVWALALETCALLVVLLHHRTRPLGSALLAGLLFYGAWSFKQTYVFGLGATLLFLLWRRQWQPLILLTLVSAGLWLATFALAGAEYRAAFRGTATTNVYYLARGFDNLRNMLLKSLPLWVMAAALLFRRRDQNSPLARDAQELGLCGLLVGMPLAFALGCKLGSASYYFFTTLVMLSLIAAGLLATAATGRLAVIGLCLATGLQGLILAGRAGTVDLSEQTGDLAGVWTVWQKQPEPRFSAATSLNLPWLSPESPPLVLAFNYPLDRAAGRPFENDGIGGLIARGFFRTLLLPSTTGETYDGGSLRLYTRGETINGLTLFHRHAGTSP